MTTEELIAQIDAIQNTALALSAQTAIPNQVIVDRLDEDGFWYL